MKNSINLLPRSFRRQQMIRKRLRQWSVILSFVFLAGGAAHWHRQQESKALSLELELLTREHRPTQTILRQLMDMRKLLEELERQQQIAQELERQRNALSLLGAVSQSAMRTKGRLRVTKLDLTGFQNASSPNETARTANQPARMVLTGVSLDNEAVGELLDGLQNSGIFSQVELRSLKERQENATSLRDYEVWCEF